MYIFNKYVKYISIAETFRTSSWLPTVKTLVSLGLGWTVFVQIVELSSNTAVQGLHYVVT